MSMKKHEAAHNQPKKQQEPSRPQSQNPINQMPPKPQNPPSTKR